MPPTDVVEALVHQAAVSIRRQQAEQALRKSEERYRTLMEQAPDPCAVANPDGRLIDLNEAVCKALGYARDELLGVHYTEILDPAEQADDPVPWDRICAESSFFQSRRIRRADGSYITFELHSAPLPEGNILFCSRDVTQRRELERAIIEIGERERRSVGQDLHDSSGQQLAAIGYLSTALEGRLHAQQSTEAAGASEIAQLIRDTVSQTRRIAHGLCPVDISEDGIATSLEQLACQATFGLA